MGRQSLQIRQPNPPQLPPAEDRQNAPNSSHRFITRAIGAPEHTKLRSPLSEQADSSPLPGSAQLPESPQPRERRSVPAFQRLTEPNTQLPPNPLAEPVTRSVTRGGADALPPPVTLVPVGRAATRTNDPLLPTHRHKPRVKVLLLVDEPRTDAERIINANDVKCFRASCDNILGLEKENIRTNLSDEGVSTDVGTDLRWFLDPNDILPGGILIMLVTGHGYIDITSGVVSLMLFTSDGIRVDTKVLNAAINRLPGHCTFEVVIGTCYAEGLIPGLHRIEVMGASRDATSPRDLATQPAFGPLPSVGPVRSKYGVSAGVPLVPNNDRPSAGLLSHLGGLILPRASPPKFQLETQATVIFWAAASATGKSFAEVLLPTHSRQLCVMIGAIHRAWRPGRLNITRRDICDKIRKANITQDRARLKYYASNPDVPMPADAAEPGMAILFSSSNDRERILASPIFQPLDPPMQKSLLGGYTGGRVDDK